MKDLRRSFIHEREEPDTNPPSERSKTEQDAYLTETVTTEIKKYNPDYGDDRICICGHPYYRHFDTYNDMEDVGCKYCNCPEFLERKEVKVIMNGVEKRIEEKEEELKELLEERNKFDNLTIEQQLATTLHKLLCPHNHTDMCGWYYRKLDWAEYSHERYLKMATSLLALEEDVKKIVAMAEAIKKFR